MPVFEDFGFRFSGALSGRESCPAQHNKQTNQIIRAQTNNITYLCCAPQLVTPKNWRSHLCAKWNGISYVCVNYTKLKPTLNEVRIVTAIGEARELLPFLVFLVPSMFWFFYSEFSFWHFGACFM